jgi:outer membrane protein TolC
VRQADTSVALPANVLREISDPMLTPVPRAQNELVRWQDALEMTRKRSTDLRAAYAQVQVARGLARQTLAASLPTLIGDAALVHHLLRGDGFDFYSGTARTIPDPATSWTAGVTLAVPVLAARSWYDYGTAKDAVRATELDAREVERQVVGGLAQTVVEVITAERLAEVTRVNLRFALSTLDLNERRARLGSASAVDVLRAQQEVSVTRAQVVTADEAVFRARENLGIALGYEVAWGVSPTIKLDKLRHDAAKTCTQGKSIEERPDVRAAQARLGVAEREVNSVSYSFLPEVTATSRVQYYSVDRFSPNQEFFTWTIGGLLTWHLYDGGFRYGERTTNEGLRDIAEQNTIALKRQARIEVERAYRDVMVAKHRLDITKQSRDIALASAKLSQLKFVNGTGTSFDMIDTQRTLQQAELDVTIDEFALLRAEIAAYLALATCDV